MAGAPTAALLYGREAAMHKENVAPIEQLPLPRARSGFVRVCVYVAELTWPLGARPKCPMAAYLLQLNVAVDALREKIMVSYKHTKYSSLKKRL